MTLSHSGQPADEDRGTMTTYVDGAFPPQHIAYLNQLAERSQSELQAGSILSPDTAGKRVEEIRRSEVFWLQDTAANRPIMQLIAEFVKGANAQVFGYELQGFEPFQLATYRAENQGFYDWHVDIGGGATAYRKLSLVIPLTDPSEYEGGAFQCFFDNEPETIPMPAGRVLAFPSYMLHRVTPVTKGIRRSLAIWACGRPFR